LQSGRDRGALLGIPIGYKDVIATEGVRTTAHSRVLLDWSPTEDASVVRRMRRAGVVQLGKHALHEFAYSRPDLDTPFPPARNPWNTEYEPGGSSSGSAAAVAAGLCFGAIGTDTGASVRKPAAYCGVVGVKPTYGRVSRRGAVPLSWTLDHIGPIARYVEDAAFLLRAIAGHDPKEPTSSRRRVDDYAATLHRDIDGLRLGVPRAWLHDAGGIDSDVGEAFEEAVTTLARLGAVPVDVDASAFIQARDVTLVIVASEAYAYHELGLQEVGHLYGAGFRAQVLEGAMLSAADYIQALRARSVIAGEIDRVFSEVELVVSPTMATAAGPIVDAEPARRYGRPNFTSPYNLCGLPAV
jgi:aspartyl-tRNA(Asn)/glutamyl-tRNA(Gln) amidotransferase subunit A